MPLNEIGENDDVSESIRAPISAAIVHAPTGTDKLEIEIRGRLDELLSAPMFMRRSAGGTEW